ncbi:hypothetical protein CIL05_07180 [Virgibacillus profundi]|uniref:Uncharacterized protein n=1 Tax=Virgibacillus profundi TaxID=2024555 RepID=A0A2A2IGM9_9BACI|nr:hypothetical protein [Virgibacillus profundi]PAV30243.1 hypothetical protein CIL05_07180 [Virgibacillus profundi]PXY54415.1 hypothetical protein CIT14_07265 [Virgibacillus profundi]
MSNEKLKQIVKSKWFKLGIVGTVLVAIGAFLFMNISSKGVAKNFAEDYMDAVKNGEDTSDFISRSEEGFIDVFDYDYLKEVEMEQEKVIMSLNYEDYEILQEYGEKNDFDSYDEFKKHYKDLFSDHEIIRESDMSLELWEEGEFKDRYSFLYDVTIANGLGQKIYKKAELTVEKNVLGEHEITFIDIK